MRGWYVGRLGRYREKWRSKERFFLQCVTMHVRNHLRLQSGEWIFSGRVGVKIWVQRHPKKAPAATSVEHAGAWKQGLDAEACRSNTVGTYRQSGVSRIVGQHSAEADGGCQHVKSLCMQLHHQLCSTECHTRCHIPSPKHE
jgi:hypothetical protein